MPFVLFTDPGETRHGSGVFMNRDLETLYGTKDMGPVRLYFVTFTHGPPYRKVHVDRTGYRFGEVAEKDRNHIV